MAQHHRASGRSEGSDREPAATPAARGTRQLAPDSAAAAWSDSPRQTAQRQLVGTLAGHGPVPQSTPASTSTPASASTGTAAPGRPVAQRALMAGVGDETYRTQATKHLEFEEHVGRALASDGDVMHAAEQIRLYSGAPSNFVSMTEEDRQELSHLVGPIGGARDLREDRNTLDANVLATHLKIDRASNRDPQAPDPTRRNNRFNRVSSPDNPIYPWNIHDFDTDLFKIGNWEDLPPRMAEQIRDRWEEKRLDDESYALTMSLTSLRDVVGLSGMDAKDIIALLSQAERKTFLYDILAIKWSTSEDLEDEASDGTPRTDNPLGPEYRQHNTGNRANVVLAHDAIDPAVGKWVADALLHNKPIISGPSGHTLRYLNHWAEMRRSYMVTSVVFGVLGIPFDLSRLPSLEVARFVMMANLMPPKDHHSYHEIMGASIGISDFLGTLTYPHPESYVDLNAHPIGQRAFQQATRATTEPNTKPLPNPWARQGVPTISGWPPSSAQDLFGVLMRFASNAEAAELILQGAGSRLRIAVIPLVEEAASNRAITGTQKEFVLDTIRRMG